MALKIEHTWVGFGTRVGAGIFGGFEHTESAIFRLNCPSQMAHFQLTNARLGLRAGGSIEGVFPIVLNCPHIQAINGTSCDSHDFSFAVGGGWAAAAKAMSQFKLLKTLAKIVGTGKLTPSLHEVHELWEFIEKWSQCDEVGEALEDEKPKVMLIAGTLGGIDLGYSHSFGGKIEISRAPVAPMFLQSPDKFDSPVRSPHWTTIPNR
jgi:hypothetical protein